MKGNYLITTDEWFVAPDGKQYHSAWGNIEILGDDILGIKTNRMSVNWFAKVGDNDKHIIIAGCQIHYAVICKEKPNTKPSESWSADVANGLKKYKPPSRIYIAQ